MKENRTIKWIGLAKVKVLNESDIFDGYDSAFTNVVGLAKSKSAFRKAAKNKLHSMDLKLIRLEGSEPLADRLNKFKVAQEILTMANGLSKLNTAGFSTFHSYLEDEHSK
jgi:hypothetical protein